jgi:putative membrane protein
MKSITTLLVALPILLLTAACDNSNARTNDEAAGSPATSTPAGGSAAGTAISDVDRSFVQQAAASGMSEVEQGRMASSKASNDAVRQYGNRLEQEHSAANNELMAIAQRHNIEMNTQMTADRGGSVGARDDATTATKTGASPRGTANPTGTTGAAGTIDTTGQALDRQRAGMTEPWMQATGEEFDRGFVTAQIRAHQDAISLFEQQASNGGNAELKAFASKQLPALREHLRQAEELQRKLSTTGGR